MNYKNAENMHISIIVIMTIFAEHFLTELSSTTEQSGKGPIQCVILVLS